MKFLILCLIFITYVVGLESIGNQTAPLFNSSSVDDSEFFEECLVNSSAYLNLRYLISMQANHSTNHKLMKSTLKGECDLKTKGMNYLLIKAIYEEYVVDSLGLCIPKT